MQLFTINNALPVAAADGGSFIAWSCIFSLLALPASRVFGCIRGYLRLWSHTSFLRLIHQRSRAQRSAIFSTLRPSRHSQLLFWFCYLVHLFFYLLTFSFCSTTTNRFPAWHFVIAGALSQSLLCPQSSFLRIPHLTLVHSTRMWNGSSVFPSTSVSSLADDTLSIYSQYQSLRDADAGPGCIPPLHLSLVMV